MIESRILTVDEISNIMSFQIHVISNMERKEFFMMTGDDKEIKSLINKGIVLAAFDNNEMIGYASLCWCDIWLSGFLKKYETKLNLNSSDIIGEFGYMTKQEYQGRGITSNLVKQIIEINKKENYVNILMAYVHPENFASINILSKNGLQKVDSIVMNSGHERDVLIKKI
ncbi:MAG: GNAT family N-acetyltransferase [Firmicutes bacterium]|nr:GNAT family N-acetyltransferase [Bacillota bacterium]